MRRSRSCRSTSRKARARTISSSAFVKEYGAAVLAIPTGGFSSVSWVLPYGLAALGLLALVVTARRWTSQPAAAGAGGVDIPVDPAIDARLDDELRDLD